MSKLSFARVRRFLLLPFLVLPFAAAAAPPPRAAGVSRAAVPRATRAEAAPRLQLPLRSFPLRRAACARPAAAEGADSLFAPDAALAAQQTANFSAAVPAAEKLANASLTTTAFVSRAALVSNAAGQVCALWIQDFELWARCSANGGSSFEASQKIAGGASGKPVLFLSAAMTTSGAVRAAFTVADADGGVGLQFVRRAYSSGYQAWSAAADVIPAGNAARGVAAPVVAVRPASDTKVAIAYLGADQSLPYVSVSTDGGATFAAPQRVGPTTFYAAPSAPDAVLDNDGTIYVAYSRATGSTSGTTVKLAKEGSFATESDLGSYLTATGGAGRPDLAVAVDGSSVSHILVGEEDLPGDGTHHLYVLSSTNKGTSFGVALDYVLDSPVSGEVYGPVRMTVGSSGEVLLLYAQWIAGDAYAVLDIHHSANYGASWNVSGQPFSYYGPATRAGGEYYATRSAYSGGRWVVAWTDSYDDATRLGQLTSVYGASSADGATWSDTPSALPVPTPATVAENLQGLAAVDGTNVVALYSDGRLTNSASRDLYYLRAAADLSSLPLDAQLDGDASSANATAANLLAPAVAADGAGRVYVASTADAAGVYARPYVARTDDNGATFTGPAAVGGADPSSEESFEPRLAATYAGGKRLVYLAFQSDLAAASGSTINPRIVRFNYSNDGAATWQATDVALETISLWSAGVYSEGAPDVQIAPLGATKVFAAWSNLNHVRLAVGSWDAGVSTLTMAAATSVDGDAADTDYNYSPRICVGGGRLVLAYLGDVSPDGTTTVTTVWARASADNGATWTARQNIGQSAAGSTMETKLGLACDASGNAVAVWSYRSASGQRRVVRRAAFTSGSWGAAANLTLPSGTADLTSPEVSFGAGTKVVAAFADAAGAIYAASSSDRGATFAAPTRLDPTSPDASSYDPRLVADGQGNAWVAWLDYQPGNYGALVARHTPDDGATWRPVYRLDKTTPQGSYPLAYDVFPISAASPRKAFFVFNAWRTAQRNETVFQSYLLDDPWRSGLAAAAGPTLTKDGTGRATIAWTAVSGATSYDVLRGQVAELRSDAGFGRAASFSCGTAGTSVADAASPGAGQSFYYLVRGRSAAGKGTFGDFGTDVDTSAAVCP